MAGRAKQVSRVVGNVWVPRQTRSGLPARDLQHRSFGSLATHPGMRTISAAEFFPAFAATLPEQHPIDPMIKYWGLKRTTGVKLKDLCEIGLDRRKRVQHATFLHRELKIRLAQRVLELQSLPDGLPQREGIRDVIEQCERFVFDLANAELPDTAQKDEEFTNLLSRCHTEQAQTIKSLALGVQGLMDELGPEYAAIQPQVDAVLRRFFMARIGLRFLIQHHVESFENKEGFSGILELECDPTAICRKAARDSAALCRARLGQAPPIIVHEISLGRNDIFTYVPMHVQYMLTEVFKNACRAVVERHGHGFDDELPAVRCLVVYGEEDVSIKVSDEGGGISRSRMQDVWKFMYTTVSRSPWDSMLPNRRRLPEPVRPEKAGSQRQRTDQGGVLAGFGVGLTLTRLYTQYFGGDMRILSLDGFGTDVYLHLNRLGNRCENLPRVVLNSPSMHDSSLLGEDEQPELILISHDEAAFLRRELMAIRREHSAK